MHLQPAEECPRLPLLRPLLAFLLPRTHARRLRTRRPSLVLPFALPSPPHLTSSSTDIYFSSRLVPSLVAGAARIESHPIGTNCGSTFRLCKDDGDMRGPRDACSCFASVKHSEGGGRSTREKKKNVSTWARERKRRTIEGEDERSENTVIKS